MDIVKKIMFVTIAIMAMSLLASAGPRVTFWDKGDMYVFAIVKGDETEIIDGLISAINRSGGTVDEASKIGSTTVIKTDWFSMDHPWLSYDCRISYNIKYSHENFYRITSKANLRSQDGGLTITDNEVRPFMREIIKKMATGGSIEPK